MNYNISLTKIIKFVEMIKIKVFSSKNILNIYNYPTFANIYISD